MLLFLLIGCLEPTSELVSKIFGEEAVIKSYEECFPHVVENFDLQYLDIEQEELTETCAGTFKQDFSDIEHVIFLGDSVTVGTYPTLNDEFYRSRLTQKLAEKYELQLPEEDWYSVGYNSGQTLLQRSGDFSSCAKLGAKAEQLNRGAKQLESCFTNDLIDKKLLVIMTMGGNDLHDLTESVVYEYPEEYLWNIAYEATDHMREGLGWLADEERFPNGISVVYANVYEFTDATGDAAACPLSSVVGLDVDIDDPILEEITIWMEKEYLEIGREYGFDMLFLMETFCGHGFRHDDPEGRCYLGPDTERWFDDTCLHPTPKGHEVIADMFFSVIDQ